MTFRGVPGMISVSYETKVGIAMIDEFSRQKLELLCDSALFAGVDEIVVEQIVSDQRCTCRTFSKGEVLFDVAHFQRCLGILLTGKVRVEKPCRRGKVMKMSVLRPGECFGAAAMFQTRERYAAILTAEMETEILFLPEELLRWAMQRNFTVTENYIQYLSDRIWFLSEKITNLTAGTAEEQLALFLAEHCEADGTLHTSMTDLCRQLNFSRATLYRAMGVLEAQWLIFREKKALQVTDMEKLQKVAQGE